MALTAEIRRIHNIRPATPEVSAALRTAEQAWHDRVIASGATNCYACPACKAAR